MHNVALLPWFAVDQERQIRPFTLLPYLRTGSADSEEQRIVRAATDHFHELGPGRERPEPIDACTVVRLGAGSMTRELSDAERGDAFELTELLATCALAGRDFFGNDRSYCNREGLRVFVQQLASSSPGGCVLQARRRDGCSQDYRTRSLPIVRQGHVVAPRANSVDWPLLDALLSLRSDATLGDLWDRVRDSLHWFNAANTDADTTSLGQEAVFSFGAIQRLLGTGHLAKDMVEPFSRLLKPREDAAVPPTLAAMHKTSDPTVRGLWILQLARVRNDFGHGRAALHAQTFWSLHEHVLVAAVAFPLLLKSTLKGTGLYAWTGSDDVDLEALEARMLSKPFRPELWTDDGEEAKGWRDAATVAGSRLVRIKAAARSGTQP
ncbi:MAG: hypothetical protein MUC36_10045 [Planctomycetes bacterium]|jgi:hypothetical protein|nr:hypothetical protein [Planctomycetota bacterium]